jgi:hypothetical protein
MNGGGENERDTLWSGVIGLFLFINGYGFLYLTLFNF